ncbi:MAG: AI-2E family transporter [Alphaproteobacteria bacterium]|nr:AI-2E family transporter [Alphaproteobacteria bacterium]
MTDNFETPHGQIPHPPSAETIFVRRVLIAAVIVGILLALWQVSLVLIILFGGVVMAVALRNISAPVGKYLRISDRLALFITVANLSAVVFGFFDLFGTMGAQQFSALVTKFPGTIDAARAWLGESILGRDVLAALQSSAGTTERLFDALPLAGGILGGLGEALLMIVVGIYLAADPQIYAHGVLRLVPPNQRVRAHEILDAMGSALQKWLLGMTIDMLLLGLITFVGLWAIGVPLPFALAVLLGVSVFVPYIGPLIATIPGLLLALSVKPTLALYAAGVYLVVLTIEAYFNQPLLQRWTVSLPPIFNLLAILVFAPLFGIWGAVLATPLAVVLWVLIQMLYIEDVLEDRLR